MEKDILKLILSNQGAVNTEELVFNLCDTSTLSKIICKNDKLVSCIFYGQPKVVARTTVGLCWPKDCQGCGRLHLCKNFLFSGSCHFSQTSELYSEWQCCVHHDRRGCRFSHDLHSDHNLRILIELELEMLSRTELCILLLQSNNTLLPCICHNYNNNSGCLNEDCPRLHICERFLGRNCSCFRNHDFFAPQPLKRLSEKYVPDNLFPILKSVYANKAALRFADKAAERENSGNRGNKGSRGKNPGAGRTLSHSDVLAATNSDDLTSEYDPNESSQDTCITSYAEYDFDSGSDTSVNENTDSRANSPQAEGQLSVCDSSAFSLESAEFVNSEYKKHSKTSYSEYDSDSSSNISGNQNKNVHSGRGNQGNRGNRGSRGNRRNRRNRGIEGNRGIRGNRGSGGNRGRSNPQVEETFSHSDSQAVTNTDYLNSEPNNSSQDPNPTGDKSNAIFDKDSGSDISQNQNKNVRRDTGGGYGAQGQMQNSGNDNPRRQFAHMNNSDANSNQRQRVQRDKTEICMYFIKGHCKHEERCFKAHDKMPYRWEIKQNDKWTPMADNEKIEQDYCDPKNTYSNTCPPVHFDTMTCGQDKVRRLSTINSVLEPDFIHTTDWLWYWEDEYGKWYQYAAVTSEHRLASITSKELEEMYLKNDKDVVKFNAGSQAYELSFQDMIQTNEKYSTKRLVRRRPQFVSAADVQTKRKRPAHSTAVPDHWDKTQILQTGYKRVSLQSSSGEYKEIEELFCNTMSGFDILKIERIQNKSVWEAFQLHKNHMKNNNRGQPVTEKKLFHGTVSKYVNTICTTNFDWRVCGVNGTAYGQGSYFARDAKYSHNYTGDSDDRFMFVSRVLVGDYTNGRREYKRPPSKDDGDVNLYNSCVDKVANPSIFVVFEKQQIYPEYLLQYKERGIRNVYLFPPTATATTGQTALLQATAPALTSPPAVTAFASTSVTSATRSTKTAASFTPRSTTAASSFMPSSTTTAASSFTPSSTTPSGYSLTPSSSTLYTTSYSTRSPTPPKKDKGDKCVIA